MQARIHSSLVRSLVLALLTGLTLSRAQAQTVDRGPLILELPASTGALSMGNAFSLASRESAAIFYHPGLLGRAQGFQAAIQRFSTRGSLSSVSAATSWFGGGVAIGIQQLSYETLSATELALRSSYFYPKDEANLRNEGSVGVSETALSVGYGKTLWGLQAGVVGKLVEKRKGPGKAGTAALDVGLASSAGPVTFGLSVQNMGPDMKLAGEEIPLPTRFILGASSRSKPVGPLDLSTTAAFSYRLDGDLEPSMGIEVGYWPVNGRTFVGRVGYRYRSDEYTATPVTFGGAFMGDNIVLEYAYQGFDSGDPSHRFGIGWR